MANLSFLDAVGRRPQRVIALVAIIVTLLSLSTYFTLSPSSYNSVRQQFSSLPRPWPSNKSPAPASSGPALPFTQELKDMYTHNPGKPQSPEELLKWATKGEDGNYYPPEFVPQMANQAPRAKAGFIVLVRNSELKAMRESMLQVEFRFNRKYGYPWIFLNSAWRAWRAWLHAVLTRTPSPPLRRALLRRVQEGRAADDSE